MEPERIPAHVPDVLLQIADHAAAVVARAQVTDQATAALLGQAIAEELGRVLGGTRIPRGTWNRWPKTGFETARRDLAIYREYNGRNGAEICAKHNISKPSLFRIINEVRSRLRAIAALDASRPVVGCSSPSAPAAGHQVGLTRPLPGL